MSRRRESTNRGQIASFLILVLTVSSCAAWSGEADNNPGTLPTDPAAVEFFEKRVRPILVERCHGCHGPTKQKGKLRLDSRQGVLTGGSTGPAVVPGNPEKSLLVEAINYGELYQMPPKSKLPDEEIAVLSQWVKRGAPWGIDSTSSTSPTVSKPSTSTLIGLDSPGEFQRRSRHWSFQPIRRLAPPAATPRYAHWPRTPIDRFLLTSMERHGLEPAAEANRRVLIRRLSYDLIGLPPSPSEVAAFEADQSPDAYERLVDRLLGSPHHGERWGRHWLDLARYAETAGHEFDYETLNAYRYRDYVIRAFNADLPYDQFVIEQVAGDLLTTPRRHPSEGYNESVIGTGFFFLGEGTHSPVDVREEEMRRVDNQLDVFSKTFLGLTIACARCHDHKFDPIRADDYYALAGFLKSSRHQQAFIGAPDADAARIEQLAGIKQRIRAILREALPCLPESTRTQLKRVIDPATRPASDRVAGSFRVLRWQPFR